MVQIHTIDISPPLINSSCLWASDLEQLRELYDCPYTGAVTTRTATLEGFCEDESHTVAFMDTSVSSVNTYGYSPHPLSSYLDWAYTLLTSPTAAGGRPSKPIIISITAATPAALGEMVADIQKLRTRLKEHYQSQPSGKTAAIPESSTLIAIELNTSCPNIKDQPPPSYDFPSLRPLLDVLASAYWADPTITIGLKLPPYVYTTCFYNVLECLKAHSQVSNTIPANPFSFLTCTNTLGSSLLFAESSLPSSELSHGSGTLQSHSDSFIIGGLGGDALHSLALGNVHTFSQLLTDSSDPAIRNIKVIGVGGVTSKKGVQRMMKAGAHVIGCATLIGQLGVVQAFHTLSVL